MKELYINLKSKIFDYYYSIVIFFLLFLVDVYFHQKKKFKQASDSHINIYKYFKIYLFISFYYVYFVTFHVNK